MTRLSLIPALFLALSAGTASADDRAPATTGALPPQEAQKQFTVPEGFEVRLFASEPMVINPVAMSWDDRGRLWVVELFEYPEGASQGEKPRDTVKILEDTDADGTADKMTVFADGLNLASGIVFGDGGAYVGQTPHLLFLKDTDGDDIADTREAVLSGFGREDTHELLNSFCWGPDGWLYMTHGVFTHSKVRAPGEPDDDGVTLNAAVARVHPGTRRFEIFADGTSNPWGVDFDRHGEAFLSACVIDHMFHMAPAGLYARQGGSPAFPYAYELLPSIVDHRHFRAAYAGVQVYQGDQYPEQWRDTIFIGNIHGNCVHQDILRPNGSTFDSSHGIDFLTTTDGWFRPVSTQTGPDGALWVMDWYDKYPCYQNAKADPNGVDRTYGRIWRVVHTGDKPGAPVPSRPSANMDLSKLAVGDLVARLKYPNNWQRRVAARLLRERADPAARAPLLALVQSSEPIQHRLAALGTLHASGQLDAATLDAAARAPQFALRKWAARLTGERRDFGRDSLRRLFNLAADTHPAVRRAVAVACRQFVSGRLTENAPLPDGRKRPDIRPILERLLLTSAIENDDGVRFTAWMALEPVLASDPEGTLAWLRDVGPRALPMSWNIVMKSIRRLSDTGDPNRVAQIVDTVQSFLDADSKPMIDATLSGLIAAQRQRTTKPGSNPQAFLDRLAESHPSQWEELGTLWDDPKALALLVKYINDPKAPLDRRRKAIGVASRQRDPHTRTQLATLVENESNADLLREGIRALGEAGGPSAPTAIMKRWNELDARNRTVAAQALISRPAWALRFLNMLESGAIASVTLPPPARRGLQDHRDAAVRERSIDVLGRYRQSSEDLRKLVQAKREVVINGPVDLEAGRAIATATCLICHQFYGQGVAVGPDLTANGRSNLDALLNNILDPNQIIGRGYEATLVKTSDGRTLSGRVVQDGGGLLKLLAAGGHEETIPLDQVVEKTVTENSLMPGGMDALPDQDFRNLVWFILNPPDEKRELSASLRAQLIGEPPPRPRDPNRKHPPVDMESVSLWNPRWRIASPPFEGSPNVIPEYKGRKNVLRTHPANENSPAALEHVVTIPAGAKRAELSFACAAHEHEEASWRMRALVNGKEVIATDIDHHGDPWKNFAIDLAQHAGKTIFIRLENAATAWMYEFGFWGGVAVEIE